MGVLKKKRVEEEGPSDAEVLKQGLPTTKKSTMKMPTPEVPAASGDLFEGQDKGVARRRMAAIGQLDRSGRADKSGGVPTGK